MNTRNIQKTLLRRRMLKSAVDTVSILMHKNRHRKHTGVLCKDDCVVAKVAAIQDEF